MSCILRFSAPDCDVDAIISSLNLETDDIYRQGEPKEIRRLGLFKKSGFHIVASEAGFDEFKSQVSETTAFVKANFSQLIKLGEIAHELPESVFLFDFGINTRMFDVGFQYDYFPAELIILVGKIGAGIKLSQYPPSDEQETADSNTMS